MPNNRPLGPRRAITGNNSTGSDFLADALEEPLSALVALEVLESVALVSETLVQVCSPLCDADIACLRVIVDVVCQGEGGGVGGGASDGG